MGKFARQRYARTIEYSFHSILSLFPYSKLILFWHIGNTFGDPDVKWNVILFLSSRSKECVPISRLHLIQVAGECNS